MDELKEIKEQKISKINHKAWNLLIESTNKTTEELHYARQREINLLKQLLEQDKTITELVNQITKLKFGYCKDCGKDIEVLPKEAPDTA